MRYGWLAVGLMALAVPAVYGADGAANDPDVGKDAPEFQVRNWINSEGRTKIADMKGEVVLIADWSLT